MAILPFHAERCKRRSLSLSIFPLKVNIWMQQEIWPSLFSFVFPLPSSILLFSLEAKEELGGPCRGKGEGGRRHLRAHHPSPSHFLPLSWRKRGEGGEVWIFFSPSPSLLWRRKDPTKREDGEEAAPLPPPPSSLAREVLMTGGRGGGGGGGGGHQGHGG